MNHPDNFKKFDIRKFDINNIDVEAFLEAAKKGIKKPNIFVCGATGTGKSSLILDIFNYDLKDAPEIGAGAPVTRGVHKYESNDLSVVLHDSEGYEIGSEREKHYYSDVIGYVDEYKGNGEYDTIHEVWYCVSAGNKRFTDADADIIRELQKRHLPVCIIITKIDQAFRKELDELIESIKEEFGNIGIFTYASLPGLHQTAARQNLTKAGLIQREEMISWAIESLDVRLRYGFLTSVNGALKQKHDFVLKQIPMWGAGALAAVVGNSFVPVPFTDAAFLKGIQVVMALYIMQAYNISGAGPKVVGSVVGASIISDLGRSLANSLAKYLPVIGQGVSVANATVAATITATLGLTLNEICFRYLKTYVNDSGEVTVPFADFFTMKLFTETLNNIKENSGDLIKSITDAIKEKVEADKDKEITIDWGDKK